MKLGVDIDTVAVNRKLKRVAAKKKEIAKDRVYASGRVFEDEAVSHAPEDTGRLKHGDEDYEGIRADKKVGRKGPEVHVGTDVPYGAFQEFGTEDTDKHPFIRPALRIAVSHLKARVR